MTIALPEIHDRVAEAYQGTLGPNFMRATQARIHWICARVSGTKVLDIGCSQGISAILLGREAKRVTAVDIDAQAIQYAQNLLASEPEHVRERVTFLHTDALAHQFESKGYDTVVIGEVLEHLIQPGQLLQVASKALRDGGQIIVTVPFGINDYFDHKSTYYLTGMYLLLNEHFEISEIEPVEGWIAFVATLRASPARDIPAFELPLIRRVEAAFESLEHRYGARIQKLNDQLQALERDKKVATDKLKAAVGDLNRIKKESDADRVRLAAKTSADAKIRQLERANQKLMSERTAIQNSYSYRIGSALVKLAKRPGGQSLMSFARTVRQAFRSQPAQAGQKTPTHVRQQALVQQIVRPRNSFSKKPWPVTDGRRLRIAGIMDTFTHTAFAPEADVEQLLPDRWQSQLERSKPDFVFIESAWQGADEAWKTKVSHNSSEMQELLGWCAQSGVPTAFWNKEDPIHFSGFLPVAKQCDLVFTTDIDCVPGYKNALGHDRVYLLAFAAQPRFHNPVQTTERKDAFNFAGSYYQRYPERQRDMATLFDTLGAIRPVEIYDRNADNPHPHYLFPERFNPLILGTLPFSDIEKAYKGYRFGININTIKRSQSMFARRVFELMASNTPVVSNYSRGARTFFGDLLVSSDNAATIASRVQPLTHDDDFYRKFRLAGLRKVMSEHTYAHRLSYISSKIFLDSPTAPAASVMHVVATAHSESDVRRIIETYRRQRFDGVSYLRIVSTTAAHDGAEFFESAEELAVDLKAKAGSEDFICLWSPDDYYGPNYLTDLALARKYAEADAIGKKSFYKLIEGETVLQNPESSYQFVDKLSVRSAIVQIDKITADVIASWLGEPTVAFTEGLSCFSIDEFNYCQDAGGFTDLATVDDIQLPSTGATMNAMQLTAEAMLPCAPRGQCVGRQFDAASLLAAIGGQTRGKASAELTIETLCLDSKFPVGQRGYLWTNERFEREDLGLSDSSEIFVEGNLGSVAQFACEYYDDDGQKISHSILRTPGFHTLVIPYECRSIRFGIRLEGVGEATIKRIGFGRTVRAPNILVARSRVLVLTKQYPSYDDLYRYGFLHSRVRNYREAGISVDVCKLRNLEENGFDEFEDVDVAIVDDLAIQATLNSGQYTHVLVHALDRRTWDLLKPHLEKVKIVVWLHGAEVQLWRRREYEFEQMERAEIQRQKRLSDQRLVLWKEIFGHAGEGLKFVFVSQYFRDEIEGDFDVRVPDIAAAIIHNHIDSKQFPYVTKPVEQRTRVLSIRPYASRKYANDLTVQAILDLSKRDFFKELHFTIVGDGPLFDELTLPLRSLENVDLQRRFLTHDEVAQLHRGHGILLSPTRMDSQGVSRDEAMSSGLVPVTTAVAAIPEFVDDDCGMVVAAEDAIAMADAVEKLYREPALFQRLSAAAAQRVRSQSGVAQTIEREIALFNQ